MNCCSKCGLYRNGSLLACTNAECPCHLSPAKDPTAKMYNGEAYIHLPQELETVNVVREGEIHKFTLPAKEPTEWIEAATAAAAKYAGRARVSQTESVSGEDGYCVKHKERYQYECGPCNKELREEYERGVRYSNSGKAQYENGYKEGYERGREEMKVQIGDLNDYWIRGEKKGRSDTLDELSGIIERLKHEKDS